MCVQEEITQGVVSLSVETGKMTADLLQKAVKKVRASAALFMVSFSSLATSSRAALVVQP